MKMGELRRDAIFSSGTETFVTPLEPEANGEVTLRCRTAKGDVDEVNLIHEESSSKMSKEYSDEIFDFYSIKVKLGEVPFPYYFQIKKGSTVMYFNKQGDVDVPNPQYSYCLYPGFHTPDWAKGAVMYQIYTDRFCNGDKTNDVVDDEYCYIGAHVHQVKEWGRYPALMDVREFYGGDLQGILDKLDYLQELGIEAIYLNPIFVSPSNHKYDTQDYDYIDPHVGKIEVDEGRLLDPGENNNIHADRYRTRTTRKENLEASNRLFIKLVEELHKRGMRIIIDGVFNHCGSFNKWLDRELIYESADGYEVGAFVSPKSPYRNYFLFHRTGENEWPGNGSYDGWWGHDTLPKLNYEDSKELEEYVLGIAKKWVSPPYNVDGWRLDVAADLGRSNEYNHEFWKKFRKAVKEANPEALILAEHYGDPGEWLQGDEWDSVMNYDAFMEPVTWFLTGMEKHSDEYRDDLLGNADHFMNAMKHHMANMMTPSLQTAMNQLSNHDHSRFLTRTNHKVGRVGQLGSRAAEEGVSLAVMREAIIMQMTWPGAPTLYYGDEAGLCGFTDPDNRRTYPWGKEDKELIRFHKEMIRIHKENKELLTGSLKFLDGDYNILAYGRFNRHACTAVFLNNNDHKITREIDVWYIGAPKEGVMQCVMLTTADGFDVEVHEYPIVSGKVMVTLPGTSAIVLRYEKA